MCVCDDADCIAVKLSTHIRMHPIFGQKNAMYSIQLQIDMWNSIFSASTQWWLQVAESHTIVIVCIYSHCKNWNITSLINRISSGEMASYNNQHTKVAHHVLYKTLANRHASSPTLDSPTRYVLRANTMSTGFAFSLEDRS